MSAEYVRRHYGVDYKRGDRLVVDGRHGELRTFPGTYLGIRFDGTKRISLCHPTWRVEREPEVEQDAAARTAVAEMLRKELKVPHLEPPVFEGSIGINLPEQTRRDRA